MTGLSAVDLRRLRKPKAVARKRPQHHEDNEARALWQWALTQPVLRDHLYHVPNGGRRRAFEAARMKGMGVRAGVHDYHLPVARGGFIGAWVELKATRDHKPSVSKDQTDWGRKMRLEGHFVRFCYGWLEAKEALQLYQAQPKTMCVLFDEDLR